MEDETVMFAYSSSLDEDKIRVAETQPGRPEDNICCRLVTMQRDSGPAYKALSYVWGNSEKVRCIWVNEKQFWIHRNLYEAMLHIRSENETVRFWIDKLCINQDVISERNAQVQRMGNTFAKAEEVLIWLGPATAHASPLHAFSDVVKRQSTFNPSDWERALPILREVFCRPWFQRVWVFQEAVLARKATVILGHEICDLALLTQLDLPSLYQKIDAILYHPSPSESVRLVPQLDNLWRVALVKSEDLSKSSWTQRFLLTACQGRLCHDPRDHVFGTTGIAHLFGVECETLDYDLSTAEVYSRCRKRSLIGDINALLDPGTGDASIESGIPSWATDLSRDSSSMQFINDIHRCGGTEPSIPLSENSFSTDGRCLSIPLYFFDFVRRCSEQLEYYTELPRRENASDELESSYLDDSDADTDHPNPYGDYLVRKDAFWRTLIANCRLQLTSAITDSNFHHQVREWPREDNGTAYEVFRDRAVPIGHYRSNGDVEREM